MSIIFNKVGSARLIRWCDFRISPALISVLNLIFWFKDRATPATPLNLNQLHSKIPICLVINFQQLSNGSICQDCPNCLGLASDLCKPGGQICGTPRLLHSCLTSWAQVSAARGPGHWSAGLQWVWPMRRAGVVVPTGNLCSPHHQFPIGLSTKCRG